MPTQAEPDTLKRLLDLQSEDTEIRRLTERKASLPEAARLAEVTEQLVELDNDLGIAARQNEDVGRQQNRIEGEIEIVTEKIAKEESRLFGGAVSNPKELAALQAEVEMLKKKVGGLEDELLEVMVQKDGLAETIASLTSERDGRGDEAKRLSASVDEVTAEINTALEGHHATRDAIAAEIPDDLLALYEQLRDQKHGVGAAALEGDTCLGCHTKLPAREVEHLRAERGLQRCDNCRRILVVI
jgi:uncharacterized protein